MTPKKIPLERVSRSIAPYKFHGEVRCTLAPLCTQFAAYVARIEYDRFFNQTRTLRRQAVRKPACEDHARKFARKFGLKIWEEP